MKTYEIEVLSPKQVEALSGELKNNDYICETAGFVPLEVKFKQFEINGLNLMQQRRLLDSSDYREMYLNPDYDISIDDEPEDIIEKMEALRNHIEDVKQRAVERKVGSFEETTNSASGSATAKTEEKVETEEKV